MRKLFPYSNLILKVKPAVEWGRRGGGVRGLGYAIMMMMTMTMLRIHILISIYGFVCVHECDCICELSLSLSFCARWFHLQSRNALSFCKRSSYAPHKQTHSSYPISKGQAIVCFQRYVTMCTHLNCLNTKTMAAREYLPFRYSWRQD